MLSLERPDVVHITTPPMSHFALAVQAAEAGCDLVVEKPLSPDFATTRLLLERVGAAGRKLTVGYSYHFDPAMRKLRTIVAAGTLGEVVHVEATYGYDLTGPFGQALRADTSHWVRRLPGGLFQNVLDHVCDQVAEFVVAPQPRVIVDAFSRSLPPRETTGFVEELRVLVRGGGVTASITFSPGVRPVRHLLRVCGTRATATADIGNRTVTLDTAGRLPGVVGRLAHPFQQAQRHFREGRENLRQFARHEFHFFDGLHELLSKFYASIRMDEEPPLGNEHVLRVAHLMDAILLQCPRYGDAA